MKLPISESRNRLPQLVRQVRRDAGTRVQITLHDEVVAELRAIQPEPKPGAAAKKLIELMRPLPKRHRVGGLLSLPIWIGQTPEERDGSATSVFLRPFIVSTPALIHEMQIMNLPKPYLLRRTQLSPPWDQEDLHHLAEIKKQQDPS